MVLRVAMVMAVVVLASGAPLLPGPDHWDEIPDSEYRTVTQWGFKSKSCPVCQGMPEEMMTVYNAIKRNYAVVAIGPHRSGDLYGCFNTTWPPKGYHELPDMTANIRHLLKEKAWWGLPRYALGSSRGGEMALELALRFPLQGVASIVMGMRNETLETELVPINEHNNATWPHPPVLFLRARHDQLEVQEALDITIPTYEEQGIYVEEFMMEPYPITPEFFSTRLKGIDAALSTNLFSKLQLRGVVDAEGWSQFGNWTEKDPDSGWELAIWEMDKALHHFFWPNWDRDHYSRAFKEMLWASEAIHEQNAQYIDYVFDFFERTTTPEDRLLNGTVLDERHKWVLPSPEFEMSMSDSERRNADEKIKERKPWNWWGEVEGNEANGTGLPLTVNSKVTAQHDQGGGVAPVRGSTSTAATATKKKAPAHSHQTHKVARDIKEHTARHHHHHSTKSFAAISNRHKLRLRRSSESQLDFEV